MDNPQQLIDRKLLLPGRYPVPPKSPITVLENGVIFQKYCYNGMPYDIAVSWLQKAIRQGLTEQALHCAYEMYSLGKIFRSHLLNRLIIITSEDVGAAEPDLVQRITELYFASKQINTADISAADECSLQENIIEMIVKLSAARKSRMADWLLHYDSSEYGYEFEPFTLLGALDQCEWYLQNPETEDNVGVELNYTESDGTDVVTHKKLSVYNLWQELLCMVDPMHYNDVVCLLKVFMYRGAEYGLLHLAHAMCITYVANTPMPRKNWANMDYPNWSSLEDLRFPILNRAIDKHTQWGRKYLGRTEYDFVLFGSALNNWVPLEGEKDMRGHFLKYCNKPGVDLSQPRDYQQAIIDNAKTYYQSEDAGWLVMACGAGKTKTAFWIQQQRDPNYSIVVLPYLEILKQFLVVWSAMGNAVGKTYHYGIMASTRKGFKMSKYMTYGYIDNKKQYNTFCDISSRKILFVTYNSMKKLITWKPTPDFVVYDEAHHYSSKHAIENTKSLFLTATPKSLIDPAKLVGFYHLEKAIAKGHLTDYRIYALDKDGDTSEHLDSVFQIGKKVIVYSRTVAGAIELYHEATESCFECFFMDANTPQEMRDTIFEKFQEEGTKAAIFNCATLGEGVDLPACDTIFIHSGYNSPQRVVQAFGRPLRLYLGKQQANIFIKEDKHFEKKLKALEPYDSAVYSKVEYVD